jgi:Zn-finger domain-containing protein
MDERKTTAKAEKAKKIVLGNVAMYLLQCWEQAKLPRHETDQQNFEKAAVLIVDFMDWHRVEDNEIKFVKEKFFPTFQRVAKLQTEKDISSRMLLKLAPDILPSVL